MRSYREKLNTTFAATSKLSSGSCQDHFYANKQTWHCITSYLTTLYKKTMKDIKKKNISRKHIFHRVLFAKISLFNAISHMFEMWPLLFFTFTWNIRFMSICMQSFRWMALLTFIYLQYNLITQNFCSNLNICSCV